MAGVQLGQAAKESVLNGLLSQIEEVVAATEERLGRMDGSIARLMNPRPENPGKDAANSPTSDTIEGRLQSLQRRLERLSHHASQIAEDLQAAV